MWGGLPTCGRLPIGLVELQRLAGGCLIPRPCYPGPSAHKNLIKNCSLPDVGRVANLRPIANRPGRTTTLGRRLPDSSTLLPRAFGPQKLMKNCSLPDV